MIYISTLAAILATHYTNYMQVYKQVNTLGLPGDTMYFDEIRDNTDFGQLLHKEGLWSLYKFDEGRSLLYHLCRGYEGLKQENSPVRPEDGQCVACESMAPEEIRGLWTLHNFDWVQSEGEFFV